MGKKKYTLHPTKERILIELDKGEEKTEAGIIIPDIAKDTISVATILRFGDEVNEMYKKKGQKIFISQFVGMPIENIVIDDEESKKTKANQKSDIKFSNIEEKEKAMAELAAQNNSNSPHKTYYIIHQDDVMGLIEEVN